MYLLNHRRFSLCCCAHVDICRVPIHSLIQELNHSLCFMQTRQTEEMVACWEKPMCTPPCLSEVFPEEIGLTKVLTLAVSHMLSASPKYDSCMVGSVLKPVVNLLSLQAHKHAHTHTRTCTHTHTHPYIHTHTFTHTQTRTLKPIIRLELTNNTFLFFHKK